MKEIEPEQKKPKRESATDALRATLAARRDLGIKTTETDLNAEIARNVLHEELGYIGEQRWPYTLDEDTRDTLIAHGRQDAAHALLNTITLLKRRRKWRWFEAIVLCLLIYIAFQVS